MAYNGVAHTAQPTGAAAWVSSTYGVGFEVNAAVSRCSSGGSGSLVPSDSGSRVSSHTGVGVIDPATLMENVMRHGVTPADAVKLLLRYYDTIGGGGSTETASEASVSVQSQTSRKSARMQRWHDEVSVLPMQPGQCYLHVIRWGRRKHYLSVLGASPPIREFVAMLQPGDMDEVVARRTGLYRYDVGCAATHSYHIASKSDSGQRIGSVYSAVVAMLRCYPFVNTRVNFEDDHLVESIPLVGVVGAEVRPQAGRAPLPAAPAAVVTGALPAPIVERGRCEVCDCVVRLDGHDARCKPKVDRGWTAERTRAFLGDSLQRVDVALALMYSSTVKANWGAELSFYTSNASMAAYMRARGFDVERSDHTLGTRFEAAYTGAFRAQYLRETFPGVCERVMSAWRPPDDLTVAIGGSSGADPYAHLPVVYALRGGSDVVESIAARAICDLYRSVESANASVLVMPTCVVGHATAGDECCGASSVQHAWTVQSATAFWLEASEASVSVGGFTVYLGAPGALPTVLIVPAHACVTFSAPSSSVGAVYTAPLSTGFYHGLSAVGVVRSFWQPVALEGAVVLVGGSLELREQEHYVVLASDPVVLEVVQGQAVLASVLHVGCESAVSSVEVVVSQIDRKPYVSLYACGEAACSVSLSLR